jgi:hypothetical protein
MSSSPDIILALCLKTLVTSIQDTIIATHMNYNSYSLEYIRLYRTIRFCRMHAYVLSENLLYNLNSNLSPLEVDELIDSLFSIEAAVTYEICGPKELKTATGLRDKLVEKALEMEVIKRRGDVKPKYNIAVLRHLELV